MSKKIDTDEIYGELLQIKHLLFFLGESLDDIADGARDYEQRKPNSDKLLAHTANRCILELITLQSIIHNKVINLEEQFNG